jgi:SAM-dependent methyltransferase
MRVGNIKYDSAHFVDLFVVRQYGPFLRLSRSSGFSFPNTHPIFSSCEEYYSRLIECSRSAIALDSICIDVGCGPGRLVGEFARLGAKVAVGIDASKAMIERAGTILTNPTHNGITVSAYLLRTRPTLFRLDGWGLVNVLLLNATAEFLPFGNGIADFVCCANVLSRVSIPGRVLEELHRVIRPGGILLLSNDYDWSTEYTDSNFWFPDVRDKLDPSLWSIRDFYDRIPYMAWLHDRKAVTAFNQIVVASRL